MALLSLEGDADMYASTADRQPSYESYEYGAATCGLDLLVLPAQRANRKVYLGVHGHIRHENTSYQLYIILPDQEDIRRYQVRLAVSATAAITTIYGHSIESASFPRHVVKFKHLGTRLNNGSVVWLNFDI